MSNVYSFLDVHASIVGPGGAFAIGAGSGVAEEGISVSANGDIGGVHIGADGSGMHTLFADKSGKLVVRLLKTSPTNALLSALYAFQTANGATHGQNTIVINDSSRGDVVTCTQAGFTKAPDLNFAKDTSMVEWDFHAIKIDRALGA